MKQATLSWETFELEKTTCTTLMQCHFLKGGGAFLKNNLIKKNTGDSNSKSCHSLCLPKKTAFAIRMPSQTQIIHC